MLITSALQTFRDSIMCETGSEIGQMSATRSRWFQTIAPNCRPLDDVQDAGAALPRVERTTVHLDDRVHEGVRQNKAPGPVDVTGTLWNWTSVHQSPEGGFTDSKKDLS